MEYFSQQESQVLASIISLTIFMGLVGQILTKTHIPGDVSTAEQVLEALPHLKQLLREKREADRVGIPRQELEAIVPYLLKPLAGPVGEVRSPETRAPFDDVQDLIETIRNWRHFSQEEVEAYKAAELEKQKAAWVGPSADAIANPIPVGTLIRVKSAWGLWVEAKTITPCPIVEFTGWHGDFIAEEIHGGGSAGLEVKDRGEHWDFLPNGWKWEGVTDQAKPAPYLNVRGVIYCSCGYPFFSNVIEALGEETVFWADFGKGSATLWQHLDACPDCDQKLIKTHEDFEEQELLENEETT